MQRESRRETIKAGCLWLDGLKCHCIRGIEQGDGSVEGNESPYSIRCCVNLAAQITQPHTHLLPHICLSGISEILSKRAMRQNFLEENLLCRVQKALNKEYFITPQFLTVKHPVCKYSQQLWVRLLSLSPSFPLRERSRSLATATGWAINYAEHLCPILPPFKIEAASGKFTLFLLLILDDS